MNLTPEQQQELWDFMQNLKSSTTIPIEVDGAFRERLVSSTNLPTGFSSAPLSAITAPTGGATIDSEGRTAINAIRSALQSLGLTL